MATLTRSRLSRDDSELLRHRLESSVPQPFPSHAEREQLLQDELLEELGEEKLEFGMIDESRAGPSRIAGFSNESSRDVLVSMMAGVLL